MEKKRMDWIDGLKLIACVCVFFSHYQGFFFGACRADLGCGSVFKRIMGSSYNIFSNGNFWLCMFCLISGYFACKKRVISFVIICILAVLFHELVEVRLMKVLSLDTWKKTLNWGRKGA